MELNELNFFTCVNKWGDKLLYRGYKDGKPYKDEIPFEPTLYEPSATRTEIVSLDGKYLKPRSFHSMKDAKEFISLQSLPGGQPLYGNSNYVNQFLTEKFPEELEFDRDIINVTTIDSSYKTKFN